MITGRSHLCIAGVFGAGKTRSLAVLLIALSCEVEEFSAVIFTKENVAAKALADQISDLDPPTRPCFGRLDELRRAKAKPLQLTLTFAAVIETESSTINVSSSPLGGPPLQSSLCGTLPSTNG